MTRDQTLDRLRQMSEYLRDKSYSDYLAKDFLETVDSALALLKAGDDGWLCEKRTTGRQPSDLMCPCGSNVFFTTLQFMDGFTANELYCPNCGLSMRSPGSDKDGVWLREHWKKVLLKAQEPIAPIQGADDQDEDIFCCGSCGAVVGETFLGPPGECEVRHNYCPECGKEVLWE